MKIGSFLYPCCYTVNIKIADISSIQSKYDCHSHFSWLISVCRYAPNIVPWTVIQREPHTGNYVLSKRRLWCRLCHNNSVNWKRDLFVRNRFMPHRVEILLIPPSIQLVRTSLPLGRKQPKGIHSALALNECSTYRNKRSCVCFFCLHSRTLLCKRRISIQLSSKRWCSWVWCCA